MAALTDVEKSLINTLAKYDTEILDQQEERLCFIWDLARMLKRQKDRVKRRKKPAKVGPQADDISRLLELSDLLGTLDTATKTKAVRAIKRLSVKRPRRFEQPALAIVAPVSAHATGPAAN